MTFNDYSPSGKHIVRYVLGCCPLAWMRAAYPQLPMHLSVFRTREGIIDILHKLSFLSPHHSCTVTSLCVITKMHCNYPPRPPPESISQTRKVNGSSCMETSPSAGSPLSCPSSSLRNINPLIHFWRCPGTPCTIALQRHYLK